MFPRRHPVRVAALAVSLAALSLGVGGPAAATPLAPVSAALSGLLATATDSAPLTVLVHGSNAAAASGAARAAGLTPVTSFRKVGVVVAKGTASQVRAARAKSGVRYVEANETLRYTAFDSGTAATRSAEAQQTLVGANGHRLDGTGVTVAVIDSGIDPTHPAFKGADGQTRVG